jgi:hypothetical protein
MIKVSISFLLAFLGILAFVAIVVSCVGLFGAIVMLAWNYGLAIVVPAVGQINWITGCAIYVGLQLLTAIFARPVYVRDLRNDR